MTIRMPYHDYPPALANGDCLWACYFLGDGEGANPPLERTRRVSILGGMFYYQGVVLPPRVVGLEPYRIRGRGRWRGGVTSNTRISTSTNSRNVDFLLETCAAQRRRGRAFGLRTNLKNGLNNGLENDPRKTYCLGSRVARNT